MTSNRPYLLRAFYEWICDNDATPHVVVDANVKHVAVPRQFADDNGHVTLNIAPGAVKDLEIADEWLLFDARFGGKSMAVSVPLEAVRAIYAKENGEGMVFPDPNPEAAGDDAPPVAEPGNEAARPSGPPTLKLVD